jgi:hypothetical protein
VEPEERRLPPLLFFAPARRLVPEDRAPRAAVDLDDRFAAALRPRAVVLRLGVVFLRALLRVAARALPRREVPRVRLFPPPFAEPRPLPPPVLLRVCAI